MRKVIIIGNPIAGGGAINSIKKTQKILKGKDLQTLIRLTSKKGDAENFARQYANSSDKPDLVIVIGGDGTYNEVANGLAYSNIDMAILPSGTTSTLAKEIGIPSNIHKALDIALNEDAKDIHLGKISSDNIIRYFILMAGFGFDAESVFNVNESIKKFGGQLAYIWSWFRTLVKYNPVKIFLNANVISSKNIKSPFNIKSDKEGTFLTHSIELEAFGAIVCKAHMYAGGHNIAPDVKLTEPYFYVFLTHKNGKLDTLRYTLGILLSTHLKYKDISYFKAKSIEIKNNVTSQIDGDYFRTASAKLEIAENALKLVVNKDYFL